MDSIKTYIHQKQDEMIRTLQRLIAIPSVMGEASPGKPFGEQPALVLQEMLQICEDAGLQTKNFDNYVGTASWGSSPILGILVHLDVVPAGAGWSVDPFKGVVKNGNLYGRGAIDDKGPAVAVLYALLAVIQAGYMPKGGVRLIFGTNEENHSQDLEYYLTKESMPPLLFTPDAEYPIINIEKGGIQLKFSAEFSSEDRSPYLEFHCGEAVNAISCKAQAALSKQMQNEWKQLVQNSGSECAFSDTIEKDFLRIDCIGTAAHAASPGQGNNPLTALLAILCRSSLKGEKMRLLRNINQLFPHNDIHGQHVGIACSDPESGELTLSFSKLDVDQNGITGYVDIRYPIANSLQHLLHTLTDKLGQAGFSTEAIYTSELHKVSADSELVRGLLAAYEQITGQKGTCRAIGGATYVHRFNGVAFGPEMSELDYRMHGADEFIPISELLLNTEIYAKAIQLLATEQQPSAND